MTIAALIFPSALAATATFVVGERMLGIPKLMNLPSSIGMFCTISCVIAIPLGKTDWGVTGAYATFTLAWISAFLLRNSKQNATN